MASISKDPGGKKRILFVATDGKRRAIRLGKMPGRAAEAIKIKLEALVASNVSGCPWDVELSRWVREIPDALANKLARNGLIPKRERATLGAFIAKYIDHRQDVKPASKTVWRQGERGLVEYFGADQPVQQVSTGDAEDYKQALIGQGLAPYTVRKRLQSAKMFFTAMVKRGLILQNPFVGVQVAAVIDESRNVFVPREHIGKIMEVCPDTEWRAIVALCRYAGLRCPSEVLSLKWEHIDWHEERITVISPKTAHHPGGGQRIIPLFPELVEPLGEAFELAPDGAVHVIGRHRSQAESPAGWRNSNLRTRFEKIIRRAGLEPWPKLFHAMRASLETELVEEFPVQAVAAWLGNSPKVALKHYLRVLPEHYARAVNGGTKKAAQNAAQSVHEMDCKAKKPKSQTPIFTEVCDPLLYCTSIQADGEGFEPPVQFPTQRFSRPSP